MKNKELSNETVRWLKKLAKGPIRRDGSREAIPFTLATEMMKEGLIFPDTETARGIAEMSWHVCRITQFGERMLMDWKE